MELEALNKKLESWKHFILSSEASKYILQPTCTCIWPYKSDTHAEAYIKKIGILR